MQHADERPRFSIGTPSRERSPLWSRIGFTTPRPAVTSWMITGCRSMATRPAKPAPDRDPHPALDLLLDALGGLRDQLAGDLVEQQDRGRVAC